MVFNIGFNVVKLFLINYINKLRDFFAVLKRVSLIVTKQIEVILEVKWFIEISKPIKTSLESFVL